MLLFPRKAFSGSTTMDSRFQPLARWSYLMMQIFEARSFLDLAEGTYQLHPKSTLSEILTQQALFRSFLLSYGKCFASSGKGRSSLDANKVFAGKPESFEVHRRIMDLRNKFAAHNDVSGLDEAVIEVEERSDEFLIGHRYSFGIPMNECASYKTALAVVEEKLLVQINKALDSLEARLQKKVSVVGNEG